ncbi:phage tail tape measure protein [Pseudomonas fragi]|uniref:Phage tail tape measure protein n=1 Tax=Pseudomonas fragi TaxID=296 RepID=A0ABT4WTY1_PSEFR|nr:phage tail tape measure protein [Pseudomonas fragi]MDA7023363.1 phage tail tape measure protein [Pseudomonas fragi]
MASRSLGTLTLDLIARIGGFEQGMDRAARTATNRMGQIERSTQSASRQIVSSLKSIGVAAVGYLGTRELIAYAETWTSVQNRLKQVTVSQQELAKVSQEVFEVAQRSQAALEPTAELYQRIASTTSALGVSQTEMIQVTESISKAMSASGVSAGAAAGALVQLGQAFASGVLRGQELNSVLEQAPGLARSIADGLGVAVGDLRKLGETGSITSEKLFRAILSQTQSIDDQFARAQTTIRGAFTVLENSATRAIGTLDNTLGVSRAFVTAVLDLSAALDSGKLQTFTRILEAGLLVVLGRTAGALISNAYAMGVNIKASSELALANSVATAGEVRRLEAVKAGVVADLARARSSVASAEASVLASRQVQTADLARLQTVRQALVAELELEQQRLRAQISDIGRQQSVARMAELRLAETAIIRQLTAAEAQLTATTIAGSAAVTASLAQRTVATEALAVVNGQLAVAQVAATSTMAAWAASSTALGAAFAMAAKAGRTLLSLAAGWPGLIITVGLIAYSFLDFGDKAEEGTSKAANAFDDASTRIRRAVKGMLPDDLGKRSFEQLSGALDGLQSELKNAEEMYDRLQSGADSGGDVPFALPLDQAGERVEALKGAIQKTQAELNGVRFASDKAGQSYLDSLKKQAVVAGKLTEVEKLRAQLSAGILKLDPESEKEALKHAAAIDKVNASLKMQKADTKSVSEVQKKFASTEEDYQRQIELINTTTDARKNATEVAKLQFEIESGKLVGINALQQKRLEGLAVELDSLKQLKQANEDAAKLAAFGATLKDTNQTIRQGYRIELSGAGSGDKLKERLQADLEIQQEHDKQVSDLFKQRNAGDISQELYEQETELLSEALAERMVIQHDYYNQLDAAQRNWMDGVGDAWNNYLDQSRDISGQTKDMFTDAFSGMNDALYNFVTTGKLSFSDMAATFASSALKMLIQWGTAQVAMAALNAFTSTAAIPIVGPFAAPAAAASALGAAGSFMGMIGSVAGMAHDGIDAVPETGTWLLQKGERVTTAQTSAKLDRTLEQVAQGGGAGGKGLTVNLIEDRSRAGQSERGTNSDGSEYLNLWAAQIRSGGNEASDSLEAAYGLKRQAG